MQLNLPLLDAALYPIYKNQFSFSFLPDQDDWIEFQGIPSYVLWIEQATD